MLSFLREFVGGLFVGSKVLSLNCRVEIVALLACCYMVKVRVVQERQGREEGSTRTTWGHDIVELPLLNNKARVTCLQYKPKRTELTAVLQW
jgi:hypothetical protein